MIVVITGRVLAIGQAWSSSGWARSSSGWPYVRQPPLLPKIASAQTAKIQIDSRPCASRSTNSNTGGVKQMKVVIVTAIRIRPICCVRSARARGSLSPDPRSKVSDHS